MKRNILLILALMAANCLARIDNTFEVAETDLHAFERHHANLLDLDKPLYRLGEILQLDNGQYVVPVNYKWQVNHWSYTVSPVKVGKKQ